MKLKFNYKNYLLSGFWITLFCVLFSVNPSLSAKTVNAPYIEPTPGQIPIMCDGPFHQMKGLSKQDAIKILHEVKDCGFNCFSKYSELLGDPLIATLLDASQEVGIKYLIQQWSLSDPNYVESFVDRFKSYPAVGGWYVADEPSGKRLLSHINCSNKILSNDPDHINFMVYCTVPTFPSKVKYPKDGYKKLENYLNYIQKENHPSVWPFDYYPIREKFLNGNPTGEYYADPDFYRFLEIFRNISLKTKRPFWSYTVLRETLFYSPVKSGNTYTSHLRSIMPRQTEGTIRYTVFTSLAYGAKGLMFWGYTQAEKGNKAKIIELPAYPEDKPFEYYTEVYGYSPIDSAGNKTALWGDLKKVLSEFNKYSEIFYNAESVDIRHTTSISRTRKIKFPFGKLKSLTTESAGATVSLHKKGNTRYLMIVSHDPFAPQVIYPKFKSADVECISEITYENPDEKEGIILPPGGFAIFSWKE